MGILIIPQLKILLLLLVFSLPAQADTARIHVVSNGTEIQSLPKKKIKQIYMEGGWLGLKPLNLTQGNKLRTVFNSSVIGLTESRINSYWAQMKFSGRATPPKEFDSIPNLVNYLLTCPGCIAYLPGDMDVPKTLSIVYTLEYH